MSYIAEVIYFLTINYLNNALLLHLMSETLLRTIHADLEILKRDVSELKDAIFSEEGELSEWAKARLTRYVKFGAKKTISQQEVEKEFL